MRGKDRKLDAVRGVRKSSRNSTEQLKRIQKPEEYRRLISRQIERQKMKTTELSKTKTTGRKRVCSGTPLR